MFTQSLSCHPLKSLNLMSYAKILKLKVFKLIIFKSTVEAA